MDEYEKQIKEQQEAIEDERQLGGMTTADQMVLADEAKLKMAYFTHSRSGRPHDNFKNKLIRLSNFDGPANKRMRFYYLLLLKCSDLGPRAGRFTEFLWDLMIAESDVYAATGEGRERVMQNTQRSELLRNAGEQQKKPGMMGSLTDLTRWKR